MGLGSEVKNEFRNSRLAFASWTVIPSLLRAKACLSCLLAKSEL